MSATSHRLAGDFYSAHFLAAEFLEAVIVGLAFTIWMLDFGGVGVVNTQLGSNWPLFFATFSTLFGALLGFVITTNSIVVSLLSERLLEAFGSSSRVDDIWETLLQTNLALGAGVIVALVGLVIAGDGTARPYLLIAVFFVGCFAVVRVGRTVWIINQLSRVRSKLARRFNQGNTR